MLILICESSAKARLQNETFCRMLLFNGQAAGPGIFDILNIFLRSIFPYNHMPHYTKCTSYLLFKKRDISLLIYISIGCQNSIVNI